MPPSLTKRFVAEVFGTFWLVFGGCGAAVLAAGFPALGIGFAGVALAFGLTVVTMAYAIGHISGCHLNPAVTLGLVMGKRFPLKELPHYWVAQLTGAVLASRALLLIAMGKPGFVLGGFASNGYGAYSPGGYSLGACIVAELLLTFFFVFVILGSTDQRAPKALAPLAIGLCLTLVHLVGIPVTNLSVNPARSTGRRWWWEDGRSSSFGCSGWLRWWAEGLPAAFTRQFWPSMKRLRWRRIRWPSRRRIRAATFGQRMGAQAV
jgi:aquaporin Z